MTTKADLQKEIERLQPYQELFYATRGRSPRVELRATPPRGRVITVTLVGYDRASGGVVIDDHSVHWAESWAASAQKNRNLWIVDLGRRVEKAIRGEVRP